MLSMQARYILPTNTLLIFFLVMVGLTVMHAWKRPAASGQVPQGA